MATIILAEAVRGSISFGHVGDPSPTPFSLSAGAPRPFVLSFPSVDWVNIANLNTLHLGVIIEASRDAGVTWFEWAGIDDGTNGLAKDGVIHTPFLSVSWQGEAMLVRANTLVRTPFSYGVTLT